jgi:flagellar biosynthesis/type III secretory pathway protein FliH
MMEDILDDNPLLQELLAPTLKKQLKEKEKQFEEKEQQLEQQREEIFNQGQQAGEQQGELNASRQIIINIVEQQFPALLKLARQQAGLIEDSQTLQSVVVLLALASTEEQARDALLSWLH